MKYKFKQSQVVDAIKIGPSRLTGRVGDYVVQYEDGSQKVIKGLDFERDFEPESATSKYIIEYRNPSSELKSYHDWRRSGNKNAKGEFYSYSEAANVATAEQDLMGEGYEYRAVVKT